MNLETAIDIIESCSGFTDESTPVGEAWLVILDAINYGEADLDEAENL